MSARRGAAGLGAATVLALTAGCGMLGIGAEEEPSEEERLIEMLNESRRIESEVMAAEFRIVQNCLEDAGHTVHEPWSMQPWEEPPQDTLSWGYPHEEFLLPSEEAAEFGFGQWANAPDGWESPEAEDYYAAQEEEYEDDWEEPDTTDWDALAPEEQYAWYVAYQGEEYAEHNWGSEQEYVDMMASEAEEDYEEELAEGELEEEDDGGEIVIEDDYSYEEPKPGGCQLEMIEALYGEPRMVEETWEGDGGDETYVFWEYRPTNPVYGSEGEESMWEDIEAEYAAAMADVQGRFLDCITPLGYEGWEFTEYNSLPIWEFFEALYYQNSDEDERGMVMSGDSDVEVPPVPEDAGSTYEEWKAYEIQMAVDFGKCGEEVGYAEVSEEAYDEAHVKAYTAIEEDVYAWQQDMRDVITEAQELLDA
ncbi:hypothetical protein K3N28_21755 [Glycomyces sp. TRM65418]|uniref:hypothetical protein n=1 Tax=Glycomyces sp. TRM65418 TaxID=2867006 RepID=UPI001CE673C9|nr:hypothetical protein [Glycomyces sp. TRM65418]MCC3765689.1 hypothetical protein [Glycomyces sp. TRM65418]QZD55284.1 hypothetical protein K3N28_21640 [Glycomyces sp. TRM65418]